MNIQKLAGYKTIAVNALTLALLLLTGLTGQITDPVTLRYVAIGITVVNVGLRFLTTTPVGKQPPVVVTASGESKEISAAAAEKVVNAPGDGV